MLLRSTRRGGGLGGGEFPREWKRSKDEQRGRQREWKGREEVGREESEWNGSMEET